MSRRPSLVPAAPAAVPAPDLARPSAASRGRDALDLSLVLVPGLAGLALSILRFRADDAVGGLAGALLGVILMVVVATLLPVRGAEGPPSRPTAR
jgi:hypothetical protein